MSQTNEAASLLRRLERLAKDWPPGFWLFSAAGRLCLMQCGINGERVYLPGLAEDEYSSTEGGGVDPAYIVGTIKIPNEGGDW